jgi:hypothetical protein
LKCQDKREKRQPPLAEDRQAPVAALPKTNVQTKVSQSLTVGEFANASSLYLALLSRSSPAPNSEAAGLQEYQTDYDKMNCPSCR